MKDPQTFSIEWSLTTVKSWCKKKEFSLRFNNIVYEKKRFERNSEDCNLNPNHYQQSPRSSKYSLQNFKLKERKFKTKAPNHNNYHQSMSMKALENLIRKSSKK